jgi:hypothetical protein
VARSIEEIIAHQAEIADQFESYEPRDEDRRDARLLHGLRQAAHSRSSAEETVLAAVSAARAGGYSWTLIGSQLGTSGEAARQRYSALVR